uniref:Reverse transcriptase domain-containing protein n=1 Tax=Amphimedon queenslandica TaxID=400682 RepID=A0A1X7VWN9_AMPQE
MNRQCAQLAGAKVFRKLDARSGFWQIPLAEETCLLTPFVTPFRRYCFNKLPFGKPSAPEHFQKRMSRILEGLKGAICLVGDVLISGRNQEEHDAPSYPDSWSHI